MEPPGRDRLLIIALDVGCMWREDEIIGGAQRAVKGLYLAHTRSKHTLSSPSSSSRGSCNM